MLINTLLSGDVGLSPRARGNQRGGAQVLTPAGTIPACAGEPTPRADQDAAPWDYPRVRGGTTDGAKAGLFYSGLSPRARGNLTVRQAADHIGGTIPACAGEPRKD